MSVAAFAPQPSVPFRADPCKAPHQFCFALSTGAVSPQAWAGRAHGGHSYFLISPISRAQGAIRCDSKKLFQGQIQPGMLFLVAPGERVEATMETPTRCVGVNYPSTEFLRIMSEYAGGASRRDLTSANSLLRPNYQVERLAAALLSASELGCEQQALFLEGLSRALIACLVGGRPTVPKVLVHRPRSLTDEQLQRSIEYADSMMDRGVNLHAWAGVLGLSATEFARRFQNKIMEAPYAWFMNRRIERAKQMLLAPSHSLVDIALQTGFYSQSHFTEAFRRRVGVSPARWRTNLGR